jgi:hypothetical protein
VLLALVPIEIAVTRSQRFKMLSPLEQNLQRASHGAAIVVILCWIGCVYVMVNKQGPVELLVDDARMFIADPQHNWAFGVALAMLIYGVVRFVIGAGRVWGARREAWCAGREARPEGSRTARELRCEGRRWCERLPLRGINDR